MKKYKYSVIIPTFQEEKLIARTLLQFKSIKNFFDIEVIVSDGGSTDQTRSRAGQYADRVVMEPQRGNIASGKNFGSKFASGDILIFLDADVLIQDIYYFFHRVEEILNEDPDIDAIIPHLRIYPEQENLTDMGFHLFMNKFFKVSGELGIGMGKGECQIVRADVFKRVGGFNERLVVDEDNELMFKIRKIGYIGYLPELVVCHSPRRFRKYGYFKMLFIDNVKDMASIIVRGEAWVKEWVPVR